MYDPTKPPLSLKMRLEDEKIANELIRQAKNYEFSGKIIYLVQTPLKIAHHKTLKN